jgi:hypothetical protein
MQREVECGSSDARGHRMQRGAECRREGVEVNLQLDVTRPSDVSRVAHQAVRDIDRCVRNARKLHTRGELRSRA